MYHPASIASLSPSQISKALKGLPVRVSAGNQHDIELSKEQLKKFIKAQKLGKARSISNSKSYEVNWLWCEPS